MSRRARRSARRAIPAAIASIALLAIAGCKPAPLPEAGSQAERLYSNRCGGKCHRAYNPHAMTAAMWEVQVAAMDEKIRAAGLPLLSDADRAAILDYLKRNAGTE